MSKRQITEPTYIGSHLVPGVWEDMLPFELFTYEIPEERRSTCMDCPKTCTDGFRPDYRCCTYHPRVPNFLLGFAVSDKNSAPRVRKLRDEGWMLPEGFQATPHQWADFLADVAEDRFGKSENVLCPFMEKPSGFCKIYPFRNSVCSTFFCLHDHGDQGRKFWESLQTLVMQVELALGQWALRQAGFDVEAYIRRLDRLGRNVTTVARPGKRTWTEDARRFLWGDDFGRELEIYEACAEAIEAHREDLWEIANQTDILEAPKWEKATHRVVPEEYHDEIEDKEEDDDDDEEKHTVSPRTLWRDVQKHYHRMWSLPDTKLRLNGRVHIGENLGDDALARKRGKQSHVVSYMKRKGGRTPEWREFVSEAEADALALFNQETPVNRDTIDRLSRSLGAAKRDPRAFISEWTRKKVLVKP